MSSPTYSPGSDETISRAIDQPASLSGILINVDMIAALREEETAVLRHRESKNRLIDETFRACSPPSLIREDHIGKKAKHREAHLSFNARMFRAMANALSWDNPASTEVHFVSEAFRQLSHDEQVSLHGSRHLLKVLLVTRPFTDAEGNEASTNELMRDQHRTFMHRGRRLLMQATSQSSCRMMMLMRMPSTVNRGTIVSVGITTQQSSAASARSQNFFVNPAPRNIASARLHPQYEETVNAETYTPLLHNVELRRAHRASIDAHNEARNAMYVDPSLPSISASSTQSYFRFT